MNAPILFSEGIKHQVSVVQSKKIKTIKLHFRILKSYYIYIYTIKKIFSVLRLVVLAVVNAELGVVLHHQRVILPKLN